MNEIKRGTEHPLSILANQAYKIFMDLGFEVATGPELESEHYNFDVLNVAKDHPARDMQDTFWIKPARTTDIVQSGGKIKNFSYKKDPEMGLFCILLTNT